MNVRNKHISFSVYAWRQFCRNRLAYFSLYLLGFIVFIALFSNFIANDQPLYAKYRGKVFFPAFSTAFHSFYLDSTLNQQTKHYEPIRFDLVDWKQVPLESVIWAPITFSANRPDPYNRGTIGPNDEQYYMAPDGKLEKSPFIFRHHLGATQIGQDIAAGLVHGARVALLVGLVSVGIAALIGILLGALAGYYGDTRLYTYRGKYYLIILGIITGYFYGFNTRGYILADAAETSVLVFIFQAMLSVFIMAANIFIFALIGNLFRFIPFLNKKVYIPVDSIVSRLIEILNSLPILLLIITIAGLFTQKSLFLVMAIIGFTGWTGIARFTRAEFLRNRNMDYIAASRSLGFSEARIIFRHALPNSLGPVFVTIAFAIASAILAESALSFLGIGVPDDVVTWGSLLSQGREQHSAWWLVFFPGLAIFITVTVYNLIGEGLRDAMDPRLKK